MAESREIRQQELARLILQKARQDLALVTTVGETETVADEIIGFHVHQTIEKAIKSVLTRFGIQYEYTHDLALLHRQAENAGAAPPATLDVVDELTPFAVEFRYTLYAERDFDRGTGTKLAREFVEWAHALVEESVQPDDEEERG